MNERVTENIVRKHFENQLSKSEHEFVFFDEQKSQDLNINKLLNNASKSGNGKGRPEFIISNFNGIYKNLVIVIECKADIRKHESSTGEKYKEYAVDGVKLYSNALSVKYDVISIAISGMKSDRLKCSTFLQLSTDRIVKNLKVNKLVSLKSYLKAYIKDEGKFKYDYSNLLDYSRTLNDYLHKNKIPEAQRSLLISGILIALENNAFRKGYKFENSKDLPQRVLNTLISELQNSHIQDFKIDSIKNSFNFIKTHPSLASKKGVFENIISSISENLYVFVKTHKYHDALGQFYIEFLRYANSDKGLGIVLTPPHITELFCDLAEVDKDSIVLDNCTGTGGFLISAMKYMVKDAGNDFDKVTNIKKNQLIGIEYQDHIFTLAISNMYIHGDGKSNILFGSCFDKGIIKSVKENFIPNVGLLNPPYKSQKDDIEELEFVLNNLEMLQRGSLCVAIIPASIALAKDGLRFELKRKILENHTLEAVISTPDELFLNSKVNVITNIFVIRAKIKHPKDKMTYLGFWKDDGFIKRKYKGRIHTEEWFNKRSIYLDSFRNRKNIPGISVNIKLTPLSEWCAEEFMITDYSILLDSNDEFLRHIKKYSIHLFEHEILDSISSKKVLNDKDIRIQSFDDWDYFPITNLFEVAKGNEKVSATAPGEIPLITATRVDNGVVGLIDQAKKLFPKGSLTIAGNGASTGETNYQPKDFSAGSDVVVLIPKPKLTINLNVYILMFIKTIIRLDKFRYNYGRKWTKGRMDRYRIFIPKKNGKPNYEFMGKFIKSLDYSNNIGRDIK